MSGCISLISRLIPGLAVAFALVFSPVLAANAPPVAAPSREPIEVSPLPPVGDTAAVITPSAAPASPVAPAPAVPERAWWQQPAFWALAALIETIGAFISTVLYMRKPEQNRLVLALALTGASAVFIAVALIAWLW